MKQKNYFYQNLIWMKKFVALLLISCFYNVSFAQRDSLPVYLRFPTVPPFNIIKLPDSSRFTKEDLVKKKATLIFIFSPDCDHCQNETKSLTANIELFKKAQIVMASPLDYGQIKQFYDDYKIADYPNIIMGRDPSYFLGSFFNIRSFPAMFLYDKKGKLIKAFDGSVPVTIIASYL